MGLFFQWQKHDSTADVLDQGFRTEAEISSASQRTCLFLFLSCQGLSVTAVHLVQMSQCN